MILKPLDSHEKDLEILKNFLMNEKIPQEIKTKIELEIKKIQAGIKGEKETAYELDFKFKNRPGTIVIHNLRLEIDGRIAQIDHMVMSRFFEFYICESKSFSEGISINEQLEFTAFYNNKPYGIASPIEQNSKHIEILKYIFEKNIIELPKRLGIKIKPNYFNSILVSKTARINRPKKELPYKVKIFKNDQFIDYFMKIDKEGTNTLIDIMKVVSIETITQLGKKLVELHTPIEFNWVGKFGLEKYIGKEEEPTRIVINTKCEELKEDNIIEKKKKQYYCDICKCEINNSIVFWCRKNKEKFNDKLLCRTHQH